MSEEIFKENTKWYINTYNEIIFKSLEESENIDHMTSEFHHIIPKCLGGKDESYNLVEVTPRTHIILHLILARIFYDNMNLVSAANLLTHVESRKGWDRSLTKISTRTAETARINYRNLRRKTIVDSFSEVTEETLEKVRKDRDPKYEYNARRRRVEAPGGLIFDSVRDCAKAFKADIHTIMRRINKFPWMGFKYIDPPNPGTRIQGPDKTIYNSFREAERKTGHSKTTIRNWIKNKPEKGWKIL